MSNIKQLLLKHEGKSITVYKDTLGFLTAGIGHLLPKDTKLKVGDRVSDAQIDSWFAMDVMQATADAKKYIGEDIFNSLSINRQNVLIDMAFNLGYSKLSKFAMFKSSIISNDWIRANKSMLGSLWAKQVPNRAKELADMMLNG